MEFAAYLLYLMMAVILLWMWKRVRGMSLEEIVEKSATEHHQLTALFEVHPRGGDWSEFCHWLDQESKPDTDQHNS